MVIKIGNMTGEMMLFMLALKIHMETAYQLWKLYHRLWLSRRNRKLELLMKIGSRSELLVDVQFCFKSPAITQKQSSLFSFMVRYRRTVFWQN